MLSALKTGLRMFQQIFKQFVEDGCPTRAAALAFTSLLSLVPLMTVSFTIMTAFPMFRSVGEQIQDFIFQNFVAASAQTIQINLVKFSQQAVNLSVPGLLFLIITALLMVFTMEQAFNAIWRVKRSRTGLNAFVMYWAVLTFLPILIGVGFVLTSYFFSLPLISETARSLRLHEFYYKYFPYILTFVAFTMLYITLPNCKVQIPHAALGGLIATFLFEVTKYGFGLFVVNFPTYELLYGTLAAIPIFLVWVYLSWIIILFGAMVTYIVGAEPEEIIPSRLKESM